MPKTPKPAPSTLEAARGTCQQCQHWKADALECRRSPPVVVVAHDQEDAEVPLSVWPQAEADDWCGEFRGGN